MQARCREHDDVVTSIDQPASVAGIPYPRRSQVRKLLMARTRGRLRSVLVALAVVAGTAAVMLTGVTPAQAAVPDRFGFVLWNGAAVVPSATVPAATTVLFAPPGHYRITFPGQ